MPADPAHHLTPEIVAAWVEGRLAESDRTVAEGHLSRCADCRREVLEVQEMLASAPGLPRRFPVPLQLAAAAAVFLAVGIPASRALFDLAPQSPPERAWREAPARLTTVSPPLGARVSGPPTFIWNVADAGSRFRVTLVDEQGATLWSTETGDTAVTLPAAIGLDSSRTYFWYVDALRADGHSLTSGAQRFTVR